MKIVTLENNIVTGFTIGDDESLNAIGQEIGKPFNPLNKDKWYHKNYINDKCSAEILSGFEVNGKRYSTDIEDQVNIIGAVIAGIDMMYKCTDLSSGIKDFFPHTASDIQAVFQAGIIKKQELLHKATLKKSMIDNANTVEEIYLVKWED